MDCDLFSLDPTLCNTVLSIFNNTVSGLFGIVMGLGMLWLSATHAARKSWLTSMFALATASYSVGLAIRVLPWGVGMWFAREGEYYHPLLIENRHWTYGPSLPLIVLGIWASVHLVVIDRMARRAFHWVAVIVVCAGLLVSVSFMASKNDYWPGRIAVVEKVEKLIGYSRPEQ